MGPMSSGKLLNIHRVEAFLKFSNTKKGYFPLYLVTLTTQVRVGDARKHLAALKVECANAPANKKKRWDYDSDSDYSD